jgi:predicted GNAT family acetyltransferase
MVGFFVDTFGDDNRDYALKLVDELLTLPNQGMMIWDDPDPVTMAGFRGRTPNGVRIGMVYTPPEYRRKGYATACVAALSQHLLDSGCRYVCLYTDLTNPTSNHIYQTIGYRPVVDSDEYGFS